MLTFSPADTHIKILYHHSFTILLSLSLRFKGPAKPILERCRQEALASTHLVADWKDHSLIFASNSVVTGIA